MARFRENKRLLREWLDSEGWSPAPPESLGHGSDIINALFACLPEGGHRTAHAAAAIGFALAKLFEQSPENAQVFIRRFMWHMNEESGNIGWGIPEAFGETLAQSPKLAAIYYKVLFSYLRDLPGDSSFCDHAPLRRSCYDAAARLMLAWPPCRTLGMQIIRDSLTTEEDPICREKAQQILDNSVLPEELDPQRLEN